MNFFLRRLFCRRDPRLMKPDQLVLVYLGKGGLTFGSVVEYTWRGSWVSVRFGQHPHAHWFKAWRVVRMVDQPLTLWQWLGGLFPYMPEEPLHRSDSVAFAQTPSAKAMIPGTRVIWLTKTGQRVHGEFCRPSFVGHYVVRLDHMVERVYVVRQVVTEDAVAAVEAALDQSREQYRTTYL